MSTAKFDTWQDSAGTNEFYKCRAFVNFDGTGTVAIRASGNVDSITDNGVGDYTVNFTNDLPDTNYAVVGSPVSTTSGSGYTGFTIRAASNYDDTGSRLVGSVRVVHKGINLVDTGTLSVAIFR